MVRTWLPFMKVQTNKCAWCFILTLFGVKTNCIVPSSRRDASKYITMLPQDWGGRRSIGPLTSPWRV